MDTGQIATPIEVVGRATAFPGVSSDDPVLVVDTRSLNSRLSAGGNPLQRPGARTEFWIAGDTDEALAAVGELEAFPLGTLTAQEVKDVPFIAATIDTFAMLNVLGLAAAILVIGVLVVYLQARQRARSVSNVLSMRMGCAGARRAPPWCSSSRRCWSPPSSWARPWASWQGRSSRPPRSAAGHPAGPAVRCADRRRALDLGGSPRGVDDRRVVRPPARRRGRPGGGAPRCRMSPFRRDVCTS